MPKESCLGIIVHRIVISCNIVQVRTYVYHISLNIYSGYHIFVCYQSVVKGGNYCACSSYIHMCSYCFASNIQVQ